MGKEILSCSYQSGTECVAWGEPFGREVFIGILHHLVVGRLVV